MRNTEDMQKLWKNAERELKSLSEAPRQYEALKAVGQPEVAERAKEALRSCGGS